MGENDVRAMPSARSGELRSEPVSAVSAVPAPATIAAHTPGPWIEWAGGECPVEPDTIVDVRTRAGNFEHCSWPASFWDDEEPSANNWMHDATGLSAGADIIAYRVVSA